MKKIEIYDTTLRDGAQAEEVSFTVEDKLRITKKLDELGVHYIEGGWPGANPKDSEYFEKARGLKLKKAKVIAFGSTAKPGVLAEQDKNLLALIKAGTSIITIFGKTWDFQVKEALKISLGQNLSLIKESIGFLESKGAKVFFDAEHFFDGYKSDPGYAVKCLQAAEEAGAKRLILCDTNGGTLPLDIYEIVKAVEKKVKAPLGIHAHNDSECAVANSIIAVRAGAIQVQGTINGLGERCGNANLCSVIPNIQMKLELNCISAGQLQRLREISRFVYDTANLRHFKRQPYVGDSAFAHKGGIHASAIRKNSKTYEHIKPEAVGNFQRILISDLAGKSNVLHKAAEWGLNLSKDSPELEKIVNQLKKLENEGYQFEAAEASFELLMKKKLGIIKDGRYFSLSETRIINEDRIEHGQRSEATVKVHVKGETAYTVADGDGPINALDNALHKALNRFYPELANVELHDYKVVVLTAGEGSSAKVRVLVESGNNGEHWFTTGVSEDIIAASRQALLDAIEYYLMKKEGK